MITGATPNQYRIGMNMTSTRSDDHLRADGPLRWRSQPALLAGATYSWLVVNHVGVARQRDVTT